MHSTLLLTTSDSSTATSTSLLQRHACYSDTTDGHLSQSVFSSQKIPSRPVTRRIISNQTISTVDNHIFSFVPIIYYYKYRNNSTHHLKLWKLISK